MANILFQDLPSQLEILSSHEILLDDGTTTGRATIDKVIELFNKNWGEFNGGYLLNGSSQYITIPYTQKTKSFSVWIKPTANAKSILNFGTNLDLSINTSNVLTVGSGITNATIYVNGKATTTVTLNVWNYIFVVCDEFTPTVLEVGRYSTSYFSGNIALNRTFNRAYTQVEIIKLYNNGVMGQNVLPNSDSYASQTAKTSGTLTIGKRYIIDTFVSDDDFTNVATLESGTMNTSGCVFLCKATTPTVWTNGSSLHQIGCVAEYLPENAGRLGWIETQNGLHGQTSGSPIAITPEQKSFDYHDVKTFVTGNTTLTSVIPKGYMLKTIVIENTTANAFTLNVGSSTSGGTDVVNGAVISASGLTTITINKTFSMSADQTLYLQSANWNSSSSNIYLTMERI